MGNYDRGNRGGGRGGRGRGGFGGRDSGPREMHRAVCDNCGDNCEGRLSNQEEISLFIAVDVLNKKKAVQVVIQVEGAEEEILAEETQEVDQVVVTKPIRK